jgi:hypothetical protein
MAQSDPSAAAAAVALLTDLPGKLAEEFPRAAHQGRLDQVAALAAGLASLVGELPAEEEREAEYADRLLALYDAGSYNKADHPDHAQTALRGALALRNGG